MCESEQDSHPGQLWVLRDKLPSDWLNECVCATAVTNRARPVDDDVTVS